MKKYPVGFYTLGMCLEGNEPKVARRWSIQGIELIEPGYSHDFQIEISKPTRIESVHCWGFCRIVQVTASVYGFEQNNGCLFVELNRTLDLGHSFRVRVQALQGIE